MLYGMESRMDKINMYKRMRITGNLGNASPHHNLFSQSNALADAAASMQVY
jgi:hypothetical protein